MENFRIVLNEIEGFIDNQDGATESQLKSLWNGLSNAPQRMAIWCVFSMHYIAC